MNTPTFTVTAEGTAGHTQRDYDALVKADVDPASTQPREHPVRCWCGAMTWHQQGLCDQHYRLPTKALLSDVPAATARLAAFTALGQLKIVLSDRWDFGAETEARKIVDELAANLGYRATIDWATGDWTP